MNLPSLFLLSFACLSLVSPLVFPQESDFDNILTIRDPFLPPDLSKYKGVRSNRTEIQQFSVQEFQLSGVITGPVRKTAMLLGPNGKTYYVNEETKIGLKNGIITRITADELVVRETTTNLVGKVENIDTILRIDAESGGEKK